MGTLTKELFFKLLGLAIASYQLPPSVQISIEMVQAAQGDFHTLQPPRC